jgi:uncharacterized protein (TIGR02391 family)
VDREWMREELTAFSELAMRYGASIRPGDYVGDRRLKDELQQRELRVRRILNRLQLGLGDDVNVDRLSGAVTARSQAQRGLGLLDSLDDLETRLASDAPTLPTDQFHPWVWEAARTFWESGHYKAAVEAAASAINAHLQNKVGRRDVADDKLIQEAFTDAGPAVGKSRLRVPGDPADLTTQSRQRGALQLGLGCFFAVRNPAAHGTEEWREQEALERLATLSVLARIVDSSTVLHAE